MLRSMRSKKRTPKGRLVTPRGLAHALERQQLTRFLDHDSVMSARAAPGGIDTLVLRTPRSRTFNPFKAVKRWKASRRHNKWRRELRDMDGGRTRRRKRTHKRRRRGGRRRTSKR